LTATDVASGWIELRSLLNNAHKWTFEALSDIKNTSLLRDCSELAAYLANNEVILGGNQAGEEIRYLCAQTGGGAIPLYRPG
jgi:hypothetical protein